MNDKALRRKLEQSQRHELRGEVLTRLSSVYGDEQRWVSMKTLQKSNFAVPMEPELRYLKELGYIVERDADEFADGRTFQATAKGYALWCSDIDDATIALPDSD